MKTSDSKLQGTRKKRFSHGQIAGKIAWRASFESIPLETAIERITKALEGTFQITRGTIYNKVWPRFNLLLIFGRPQ